MKKSFLMLFCAAAVTFSACNQAEQAESETAVVTGNTAATNAVDEEAMYRDQASRMTKKMASDLDLQDNPEIQDKVQEVYYTRAKRAADIRKRHNADTSGMYAELREVNLDTDKEFEQILAPATFKMYQPRSTTYYAEFDNMSSASAAGTQGTPLSPDAEITTKTEKDGDTKTEIEDGNTEIKIKRDADGETKIKTETKN